jgi:hypothetical protein
MIEIFVIASCVYAANAMEPKECFRNQPGAPGTTFRSADDCKRTIATAGYKDSGVVKFKCLSIEIPAWKVVR